MEHDLEKTYVYQLIKNKRKALINTVVRKYDVVIVGMVRAKKQKRDENEISKAQKTVEAAEAGWEKKQLKVERDRFKS